MLSYHGFRMFTSQRWGDLQLFAIQLLDVEGLVAEAPLGGCRKVTC